jgi:lambda family phage portal protein
VRVTWLDRLIGHMSPVHGVERYRARMQMAIAGQWIGARTDRRETSGWIPFAGSADADNLFDLPMLRTRTRDLQRGNPLALGATSTAVTNIGSLSLRSSIDAKALGLSDDQAQEWQQNTEREFRSWAENPVACDAEATLDFYLQQLLAVRSALDSGDVFALLPMKATPASIYETKIQLVEADRVCNPDGKADTERVAAGIETDELGAPLKYFVMRSHPGSMLLSTTLRTWDTIPAFGPRSGRRNVVHLFEKRRPGQRRGVPYLAPVIEALHQLGEYSNAELRAAVVGAMFTVFVKAGNGAGLGLGPTGGPPTSTPQSGDNIKLGTGAIVDLAENEDVTFANPGRPNQAFDPFVSAMLGYIGAALEIPKEVLIKHFTASYSAARAALNELWRFVRGRREWLGSGYCQPIYEAWLEESIARGRTPAPGFFDDPVIRQAYCGSQWIGDAQQSIDPEKDVNAAEKRLALVLTTHADEKVALDGGVWDDTVARRGREERLLEREGLNQPAPTEADPKDPKNPDKPETGDREDT